MIKFIFCSIFILLVARLAEHKWHIVKTNDRGANKAIHFSATEDPDPIAEEDLSNYDFSPEEDREYPKDLITEAGQDYHHQDYSDARRKHKGRVLDGQLDSF